jgi:hypothetical protein
MTGLLVVAALIVLAGGGYLVLKPSTSPNELVFMRMRQAEEKMDWQAVLREAQAGNVNDPEFGRRIADLKAKAEQQVTMDAAREKLVDATKAWNAIRLWRQDDNWKNDAEYVQRLDTFLAEYGRYGGASVDIARQERAKITGSAEAGEPRNAAEAWSRLESDLKALKANGQFGKAIARTEEFATKWGSEDPARAQQARQMKATLHDEAVKWIGKQISRAQHKLDQGTKLQARKILEKAADVIGIPELEDRCAQALRELIQ